MLFQVNPFSAKSCNQWFDHNLNHVLHILTLISYGRLPSINTVDKPDDKLNPFKHTFHTLLIKTNISESKPTVLSRRAAHYVLMSVIIMVFEKSTPRDPISVKTLSSKTCKIIQHTSLGEPLPHQKQD